MTGQLLWYLSLHLTLGPPPSAQVQLPQFLEQRVALLPQGVHLRVLQVYGWVVASKGEYLAIVVNYSVPTPWLGLHTGYSDDFFKLEFRKSVAIVSVTEEEIESNLKDKADKVGTLLNETVSS